MPTPDSSGYFGRFGGRFVPEVLVEPLAALERAVGDAFADTAFWDEYRALLRDYVGRPSPLYETARFAEPGSAAIVLKREDLNHTGAHKINNTVGQGLLARAHGQAPADRGDGRRPARRRDRDDRREVGHPGRGLHGRARRSSGKRPTSR